MQGIWVASWSNLLTAGGIALRGKRFDLEADAREWMVAHATRMQRTGPFVTFEV